MGERAESVQADALRAFSALHAVRENWAGALVLNVGLAPAGAAISIAASIAGGTCLSLERDTAMAREALRSGACDFVVNTLDEALRVLKNEIRRKRPVSVGLEGDLDANLAEMIERGVAPELIAGLDGRAGAEEPFRAMGAAEFDLSGSDEFLQKRGWTMHSFGFASSADVRAFDAQALSVAGDALRRRWLQAAARFFPRERARVLWLTEEEEGKLRAGRARE